MNAKDRLHEERPWGSFIRFTHNEPTTVKLITVKPGEAFSLQRHAHRSEFWRIVSGSGVVRKGGATLEAYPGAEFFIEQGELHRASATDQDLIILEIAFGDFDESDIERVEDRYGRT